MRFSIYPEMQHWKAIKTLGTFADRVIPTSRVRRRRVPKLSRRLADTAGDALR